ncbi:MAG: hypothetical protein QNJ97_14070 [Myxococcota bacterium]|nr:hypothetical protein [Myxococcota bacterium]
MRVLLSFVAIGIVAFVASGCSISDKDRCGSGLYFANNACWPEIDTSNPIDSDSTDLDGGSDGSVPDTDSNTQPTGLGETCTGPEHGDCAAYDADFCLSDPFNNYAGICSIKDCTTGPDNCPNGWQCCHFIEMANMPNVCLSNDQYETQTEAGICIE